MDASASADERRLLRNAWLVVAASSLLGLLVSPAVAASVAAGGIIAAVNVEVMARLVGTLTEGSPGRGSWLAILWVGLRYLLLGAALFVIFSVWRANVIAVAVGLSAPVAAVVMEWGLHFVRKTDS